MPFPKLYSDLRGHNEALRAHFSQLIERPLIIVGNGPSSVAPYVDRMPNDPVVFRMNWFFLEQAATYGHRVDAFFWSVHTPALQDELTEVAARRDYDIRSFFAPMRTERTTKDGETIDERLKPMFDHWALIAENATFARSMMGRPLPTQGMQVLAFALALGFEDIYLTGFDLYDTTEHRYAYAIPDRIAKRLNAKDLTPGYESAHDYDRDISFFETCRAQYPAAKLTALSDSKFLNTYLPSGRGKKGAELAPKLLPFLPHTITLQNGERRPIADLSQAEPAHHFKRIAGQRCAFTTLAVGEGFLFGVKALAASLAKVSDVPLVVMCVPETDKRELRAPNIVLYDIPPIANPNKLQKGNFRFKHTYSKLAAFGMVAWDRLVYIDADAIVLKNIDDLFAIDEFAAAPDLGYTLNYHIFNSGVFCCQPSQTLLDQLLSNLATTTSYDGGDQGFLNQVFPKARRLDRSYNTLKRLYLHHPNLFRLEDIKVLHFVGLKPWEWPSQGDDRYEELEKLWCSFLSKEDLFEMLKTRPPIDPATAAEPAKVEATSAVSPSHVTGTASPGYVNGKDEPPQFMRKLRKLQRDPLRFMRDSKLVGPWLGKEPPRS
jgi:hypothetical protein